MALGNGVGLWLSAVATALALGHAVALGHGPRQRRRSMALSHGHRPCPWPCRGYPVGGNGSTDTVAAELALTAQYSRDNLHYSSINFILQACNGIVHKLHKHGSFHEETMLIFGGISQHMRGHTHAWTHTHTHTYTHFWLSIDWHLPICAKKRLPSSHGAIILTAC